MTDDCNSVRVEDLPADLTTASCRWARSSGV